MSNKELIRYPSFPTMTDEDVFYRTLDAFFKDADLTKARTLASLADVSTEFEQIMFSPDGHPYRPDIDLRSSFLEAIVKKYGTGSLEGKVEGELVKKELSGLEVGYIFAKKYAASILSPFVETVKGVVYPLLPGFIQGFLDEKAEKKGAQRAFYNWVSTIYDTSLVSALAYRFGLGWSIGLGAVTLMVDGVVRACYYSADKGPDGNIINPRHDKGTLGSLFSELVLTLPLMVMWELGSLASKKIGAIHEEARKEIEAKKQLLLTGAKDD